MKVVAGQKAKNFFKKTIDKIKKFIQENYQEDFNDMLDLIMDNFYFVGDTDFIVDTWAEVGRV